MPTHQYNKAGGLISEIYPSGRVVGTSYDAMNRPAGVTSGATTYVNQASTVYASNGGLAKIALGNGLVEQWDYSPKRQQPRRLQLGTTGSPASMGQWEFRNCPTGDYTAECNSNNGNLMSETISPLGVTQTFTYDKVNRLKMIVEGLWHQTFVYDQNGNIGLLGGSWAPSSTQTPFVQQDTESSVEAVYMYNGQHHNQWNGANYDTAGNVTGVPTGSQSFTYTGEGLVRTATIGTAPATVTQYTYDGLGRRVQKVVGTPGATTTFAVDASGAALAEYTVGATVTPSGVQYLTVDHLGSTRVRTNGLAAVVKRSDYLPFGEEIGSGTGGRGSDYTAGVYPTTDSGVAPDQRMFTGKERDAETGLDYFGERYFSGAQGRFTSPDPIAIMKQKVLDPQQWNMYAYARNNPLRFVDPTGMYVDDCAQGDKDCVKRIDKFEKARQKDLKSKNEAVRNAAEQYGKRGDDNGVTVHVVNAQQMQQAVGVNANGAVVPVPGQDEDRANVYINSALGGKDLQRTIAHEGTHLGMELDFINSYDSATGKYDASMNFTSGQTEWLAFMTGSAVKKYDYPNVQCGGTGGCQFGPKDATKVNQFLHNHPVYGPQYYLNIFDPRTWPQ